WYASLYLQCHSVVDADRGDCGQCRDGDSRCRRHRELYDDDTRLLAPPETQLCASVLCGFDHLLFYRFHAGNRGGLPKYKPAVAFYRFHSGPLAPYDVRHHHVHAVFFYLYVGSANNLLPAAKSRGGPPFLARAYRSTGVHHFADDRQYVEGYTVDG